MMDAIRILRGCGASGVSLAAGTVYTVPSEVSDRDADILVRLGKAEAVAVSVAPVEARPARPRKAKEF